MGRKFHPLLLLPLVAKPHADDVLFQVKFFGDGCNFLAAWAGLNGKVGLERAFFGGGDGSAFAFLFPGR